MNGPLRLRDGDGAARVLMGGSGLQVPSESRRRALTFVGAAAAGTAVSSTAAAATTAALVKGVVLCVCLGAAGDGLASLAISEAFTRLETHPATAPASAPRHAVTAVSAGTPPALPAAPDPAPKAAPAPEHAATRDARASTPSAVSNVAAAPASAKSPPGQSLFEEQRIIESARAAVARGDAASALAALDGYDRTYAQGQFGPEALALRVEALSAAGQSGRARGLAAEFQRRYPHHPLLSRVQAAVQGAASSTKR